MGRVWKALMWSIQDADIGMLGCFWVKKKGEGALVSVEENNSRVIAFRYRSPNYDASG